MKTDRELLAEAVRLLREWYEFAGGGHRTITHETSGFLAAYDARQAEEVAVVPSGWGPPNEPPCATCGGTQWVNPKDCDEMPCPDCSSEVKR